MNYKKYYEAAGRLITKEMAFTRKWTKAEGDGAGAVCRAGNNYSQEEGERHHIGPGR